jgi:nitrogen fixation-related uncharacterized protein
MLLVVILLVASLLGILGFFWLAEHYRDGER